MQAIQPLIQSNRGKPDIESIQRDIEMMDNSRMISLLIETGLYIHIIFKDDPDLYHELGIEIRKMTSKSEINHVLSRNFIANLIEQDNGREFLFRFFEQYNNRKNLRAYYHERIIDLDETRYINVLKGDEEAWEKIQQAGWGGPYKYIRLRVESVIAANL